MAKDAHSSGDPVLIENYLQHADHYARRLAELNEKNRTNSNDDKKDSSSDNNNEEKLVPKIDEEIENTN